MRRTLSLMRAGLSRRQFLRYVGVSATVVGAASLLAACEDDAVDDAMADDGVAVGVNDDPDDDDDLDDDDDPDDDDDSDTAEGRDIVIAVQQLPQFLGGRSIGTVGLRTTSTMFDSLIERDFMDGDIPGAGAGLKPMLAESWERTDDLTLEFQLREDVTFHNGDPMTAEDVKFTFERFLVDPPAELVWVSTWFDTIDEINVIDDYTVEFVTTEPDPILENRLAAPMSWIVPKDYYEEVGLEGFDQDPVGTGPYRFVSFTPDHELVLEAFEDYFMGPPAAPRVEFRQIPETAGRISALVSGEVDIITNVPTDQIQTLEEADQVRPESIQIVRNHVIIWNTYEPPLDDKRVRQAMNLAIDRELLVETIWDGYAVLTRGLQFEEFGDMYNPDRPYPEFNLERAQELLEEAGYDGEEIFYSVLDNYYTNEVVVAEAMTQMWQDAGINLTLVLREPGTDHPNDEPFGRTWSNASFNADPEGLIWRLWGPESFARTPRSDWEIDRGFWEGNERFDELGEEMRRTLDTDARFEMVQEMMDIWEDEAPGTVLYLPLETYGVREDIEWQPYSMDYIDLRPHNFRFV